MENLVQCEELESWHFSGKLLVTIPDDTRPLDPLPALAAIAQRAPNIKQVVIGLGLHKRMVPGDALRRYPLIQHDPLDCVTTKMVDGIQGRVHRSFLQAEASLSVGIAELHQYAGFSGGHKGVAVGCGGRDTILALHHRDRVLAAGVRIGALEGNPFRSVVDELGVAAGCCWALNYAPSLGKWFFGEPTEILRTIAREVRPWYTVDAPFERVLLDVPSSKGKSLYQASRAATYLALSPNPPLREGAQICISAPLEEGLGSEEGFVRALHGHDYPFGALLTGEPPTGAGAQRAVIIASVLQRYRLRLYGVKNPELFRRLGFWASAAPAPREDMDAYVPKPFSALPQLG